MTPKEQAIEMWWLLATGETDSKRDAYQRLGLGGDSFENECAACNVALERAEADPKWEDETQYNNPTSFCQHCPMYGAWFGPEGIYDTCSPDHDGPYELTWYQEWAVKTGKEKRAAAREVLFNILEAWKDD